MDLNTLVYTYFEEKDKLSDKNKSEDEIEYILGTTYLPQILHAKLLILEKNITILSLGNKTLEKLIKQI